MKIGLKNQTIQFWVSGFGNRRGRVLRLRAWDVKCWVGGAGVAGMM